MPAIQLLQPTSLVFVMRFAIMARHIWQSITARLKIAAGYEGGALDDRHSSLAREDWGGADSK